MSALSPYAETLGIRIAVDEGGTVLVMPFSDRVLGRPGFLHGGALAGLLEVAAYHALRCALGDEPARLKPITVTVDFMRGGRTRDTHARGIVTRLGRRIANVEAVAWQDDPDRPIGGARLNVMVGRGAQ